MVWVVLPDEVRVRAEKRRAEIEIYIFIHMKDGFGPVN
jgi:hypothetical protein